jgi:hypothetical protein
MNRPDDELARRVVKALNRGVEVLDAGTRERTAAARRLALAPPRAARAGGALRGR